MTQRDIYSCMITIGVIGIFVGITYMILKLIRKEKRIKKLEKQKKELEELVYMLAEETDKDERGE